MHRWYVIKELCGSKKSHEPNLLIWLSSKNKIRVKHDTYTYTSDEKAYVVVVVINK